MNKNTLILAALALLLFVASIATTGGFNGLTLAAAATAWAAVTTHTRHLTKNGDL
ncbi:hypothetical protein [Kocuria sp. TGY1127_2]|uniref:hypothetical protein n=1 Tax=Kocuria sp. TGY1127_2 TaxID=2711328 RepID=UPI0015B90CDC|nr:hypothetical protein [Kocuria sp. TGY1127_2]